MKRRTCQSISANIALDIVSEGQKYFLNELESEFSELEWFRDQGRHGGGVRFESTDSQKFNSASLNVSQVHYDDNHFKKLSSATALSCIVHPSNPYCPSIHLHVSWTEMRDGNAYWRWMVDLNPSISKQSDTMSFSKSVRNCVPDLYHSAVEMGDSYFHIPSLKRHRGSFHFYLEGHRSTSAQADRAVAQRFIKTSIDAYISIMNFNSKINFDDSHIQLQVNYHSLYFLQVLTMDRGTTSGLLVHDQNDIGILASLPRYVSKKLLRSWLSKQVSLQDKLLSNLIGCLVGVDICFVSEAVKLELARVVREFYKKHPEAMSLQAASTITTTTVDNHK